MNESQVNEFIQKVADLYDNVIVKYKTHIDTNAKTKSYGGHYYGSTELFRTSGTFFEWLTNYTHNSRYSSTDYALALKVGGQHYKSFLKFKDELLQDVYEGLKKLSEVYHFDVKYHDKYVGNFKVDMGDKIFVAKYNHDVVSGTNFSVYCGLELFFTYKDGNIKLIRSNIKK